MFKKLHSQVKQKQGIIGIVFVILVALILLKYAFNIDVFKLITGDTVKKQLSDVWYFLKWAWNNYLSGWLRSGFMFIKIVIDKIRHAL